MSIKIDLRNQVRQTELPKWKPLLPLFEAVMNSLQAVRDARRVTGGLVTIEVLRENSLLPADIALITGFKITDNGIGLDETNFESFNTAFSSHNIRMGGKGLGRFTWLKAFERARVSSVFRSNEGKLLKRNFIFDEDYDLDQRGLPEPASEDVSTGTTIHLDGFLGTYKSDCPKSLSTLIEKLIEHFLLVLLEPDCSRIVLVDFANKHELNHLFDKDYKTRASSFSFFVGAAAMKLHGFRLPTTRTTKHKLVYAAHQRAVTSDNLADHLPNLRFRLIDERNEGFFYLAVVQGDYLSEHVTSGRVNFDFETAEDADATGDLFGHDAVRRGDIRKVAIPLIEEDLAFYLDSLNSAKLDRIRQYVHEEAPQYKILLRTATDFIAKLPPQPNKLDIETLLHRELHFREVKMKQEGSRIIKESEKIDDYTTYAKRFSKFMNDYNELGVSALAQYIAHRKIILELLAHSISVPEGEKKFPLEKVVHQLVYPMRQASDSTPYSQQNLWMIDERLTFHSFISSDNPLSQHPMLETNSEKRGDIVLFDEKIIFGDNRGDEHPINSITTVEFKRPGRNDYKDGDNPIRQSFNLIKDIRNGVFKINGRRIPVANDRIPATAYCICDITPTLREILDDQDAFAAPDNLGYYGFSKNHGVYFEVIDYSKLLMDAKKRNRVFFDKLNLVGEHN